MHSMQEEEEEGGRRFGDWIRKMKGRAKVSPCAPAPAATWWLCGMRDPHWAAGLRSWMELERLSRHERQRVWQREKERERGRFGRMEGEGFQPTMEFRLPFWIAFSLRASTSFFPPSFPCSHFPPPLIPALYVPVALFSCYYFLLLPFSPPHLQPPPPTPPFVAHSSPLQALLQSLLLHFFQFHFPSRPVDAHILFTRLLSRYSMFPLCFLCCNSQRKARRTGPTSPLFSRPLPPVPAMLGSKKSTSRPQRRICFRI